MINIEKLKKIGYGDSISLKCNINRTNLTYLQNSILSEIDEMEANNKYITYFYPFLALNAKRELDFTLTL